MIRLIGHTDSTGTEKYNVGLGDRRANTVAAVLQDKLKGLSGRTKVVVEKSPGETDPTADNRTAEGQGLNRRVEVFIKTGVVRSSETQAAHQSLGLEQNHAATRPDYTHEAGSSLDTHSSGRCWQVA